MSRLNKKALVIGAGGFVGEYLINELTSNGYSVHVTIMSGESIGSSHCESSYLNVLNQEQMNDVLKSVRPDYIILLAAQSSVSASWKIPQKTMEINVIGTINLLESLRVLSINSRILLIGSSEEYGKAVTHSISEIHPAKPANPYGISKVVQKMIGELYIETYQQDIVFTRSFNHIGPKQAPTFVVSDFAKQIAEIEVTHKNNQIHVGNLGAKRDFTDVRDVVRAYRLILERGTTGEVYNVGSGRSIEIRQLLNQLISRSSQKINVVVDSEKLRPIDVPEICSDITKITNELGWSPEISIHESLDDILDYWRSFYYEKQ